MLTNTNQTLSEAYGTSVHLFIPQEFVKPLCAGDIEGNEINKNPFLDGVDILLGPKKIGDFSSMQRPFSLTG